MNTKLLTIVFLLMIIICPLKAAQYCVNSSNGLSTALLLAGVNGEADFIRIEQGVYTVPSGGFFLNNLDEKDINISGDWVDFFGNPCGQQVDGNAFNTILDGDLTEQILKTEMYGEADIRIANLFFANGYNGDLTSDGKGGALLVQPDAGYQGEILIENNAFINNIAIIGSAISVQVGSHLMTIRNNLFTINKSLLCCVLELQSDSSQGIYLINNTIYQNTYEGTQPEAYGGVGFAVYGSSQAFIANNILWGNDTLDIFMIGDGFIYLKNNNIGELFGAAQVVANNISAEPNFEVGIFNYTPAAGSKMINAGLEPVSNPLPFFDQNWDLGIADLVGDARVQMGAVDIGAVESSQLDVIFDSDFEIIL